MEGRRGSVEAEQVKSKEEKSIIADTPSHLQPQWAGTLPSSFPIETHPFRSGDSFYEPVRQLGRGSSGQAYLCQHRRLSPNASSSILNVPSPSAISSRRPRSLPSSSPRFRDREGTNQGSNNTHPYVVVKLISVTHRRTQSLQQPPHRRYPRVDSPKHLLPLRPPAPPPLPSPYVKEQENESIRPISSASSCTTTSNTVTSTPDSSVTSSPHIVSSAPVTTLLPDILIPGNHPSPSDVSPTPETPATPFILQNELPLSPPLLHSILTTRDDITTPSNISTRTHIASHTPYRSAPPSPSPSPLPQEDHVIGVPDENQSRVDPVGDINSPEALEHAGAIPDSSTALQRVEPIPPESQLRRALTEISILSALNGLSDGGGGVRDNLSSRSVDTTTMTTATGTLDQENRTLTNVRCLKDGLSPHPNIARYFGSYAFSYKQELQQHHQQQQHEQQQRNEDSIKQQIPSRNTALPSSATVPGSSMTSPTNDSSSMPQDPLKNQHISKILEQGKGEGVAILMEYCENGDLAQMINHMKDERSKVKSIITSTTISPTIGPMGGSSETNRVSNATPALEVATDAFHESHLPNTTSGDTEKAKDHTTHAEKQKSGENIQPNQVTSIDSSNNDLVAPAYRLPESAIWCYIAQLCLALHHVHAHGIAHRDVKSANVFVGERIDTLSIAKSHLKGRRSIGSFEFNEEGERKEGEGHDEEEEEEYLDGPDEEALLQLARTVDTIGVFRLKLGDFGVSKKMQPPTPPTKQLIVSPLAERLQYWPRFSKLNASQAIPPSPLTSSSNGKSILPTSYLPSVPPLPPLFQHSIGYLGNNLSSSSSAASYSGLGALISMNSFDSITLNDEGAGLSLCHRILPDTLNVVTNSAPFSPCLSSSSLASSSSSASPFSVSSSSSSSGTPSCYPSDSPVLAPDQPPSCHVIPPFSSSSISLAAASSNLSSSSSSGSSLSSASSSSASSSSTTTNTTTTTASGILASVVTLSDTIIGTPYYLAPEVIRKEKVDMYVYCVLHRLRFICLLSYYLVIYLCFYLSPSPPFPLSHFPTFPLSFPRSHHFPRKCDMWSLGVLLYELCLLRRPFRATTLPSLLHKILTRRLKGLPSYYSRDLNRVIGKCFNSQSLFTTCLLCPMNS